MEYEIYVISYNLGSLLSLDAAVSTTSHDRAESLLEEFLDECALSAERTRKIIFEVVESYQLGTKTDTERVIIPSKEIISRARRSNTGTGEVN